MGKISRTNFMDKKTKADYEDFTTTSSKDMEEINKRWLQAESFVNENPADFWALLCVDSDRKAEDILHNLRILFYTKYPIKDL